MLHSLNWFKITERKIGVNAPPFHPNCRCCTAPYVPPMDNDKLAAEVQKKLDNSGGSGIIESEDISKISNQKWTSSCKQDGVDAVLDVLKNSSTETVEFWNKYGDLVQGDFYDLGTSGCYNRIEHKVHLNLDQNDERSKRIGTSKDVRLFFHETGHLFDWNVLPNDRIINHLPELLDKLESDTVDYINKFISSTDPKAKAYKSLKRIKRADAQMLRDDLCDDKHLKNAISDIIGGLTNNRIMGGYGHKKTYWKYPQKVGTEAVAHMFECMAIQGERLDVFKKYFPTAYDYFLTYIKTLI